MTSSIVRPSTSHNNSHHYESPFRPNEIQNHHQNQVHAKTGVIRYKNNSSTGSRHESACDLCHKSRAAVSCRNCDSSLFCASCDRMYHRHLDRRYHLRNSISPAIVSIRNVLLSNVSRFRSTQCQYVSSRKQLKGRC